MKRLKTSANAVKPRQKADKFKQVYNDKGRLERGLWLRKGRFYAQLDANNSRQYKVPSRTCKHGSTSNYRDACLEEATAPGETVPALVQQKRIQNMKDCTKNDHTSQRIGLSCSFSIGSLPASGWLTSVVRGPTGKKSAQARKKGSFCVEITRIGYGSKAFEISDVTEGASASANCLALASLSKM